MSTSLLRRMCGKMRLVKHLQSWLNKQSTLWVTGVYKAQFFFVEGHFLFNQNFQTEFLATIRVWMEQHYT